MDAHLRNERQRVVLRGLLVSQLDPLRPPEMEEFGVQFDIYGGLHKAAALEEVVWRR